MREEEFHDKKSIQVDESYVDSLLLVIYRTVWPELKARERDKRGIESSRISQPTSTSAKCPNSDVN
jgi:hypothetical protein